MQTTTYKRTTWRSAFRIIHTTQTKPCSPLLDNAIFRIRSLMENNKKKKLEKKIKTAVNETGDNKKNNTKNVQILKLLYNVHSHTDTW